MAGFTMRERLEDEVQRRLDSGWDQAQIERSWSEIEASAKNQPMPADQPGPWSDDFPAPRGVMRPPEAIRQRSQLEKAAGAAADWAEGSGRAFGGGMASGATMGAMDPQAQLDRAREQWFTLNQIHKLGEGESFRDENGQVQMAVSPSSMRQAERDLREAEANAKAAKEHSLLATGGQIAGGGYGLGARVAGNFSRAIPGRTGELIGAGVGGATDATGAGILRGEDAGDALMSGARGGAASVALAGLAGASRDAGRAASPWVGTRAAGELSGEIDAVRGGGRGLAGVRNQTAQSRQRILRRDAEMADAELAERMAGEERLMPGPQPRIPSDRVLEQLDNSVERYDITNAPVNERAAGMIDKVKRNLSRPSEEAVPVDVENVPLQEIPERPGPWRQIPGHRQLSGDVPDDVAWKPPMEIEHDVRPTRAAETTPRNLLLERRRVRKDAGFGSRTPTDDMQANRDIYGAVDDAVKGAVPGLRDLDAQSHQQMNQRRRLMDNLVRNENGPREVNLGEVEGHGIPMGQHDDINLRVGDELAIDRNLMRYGDSSIPGELGEPYLAEVAKRDPEFAAALRQIQMKKAYEGTRLRNVFNDPIQQTSNQAFSGINRLLNPNSQIGRSLLYKADANLYPPMLQTAPGMHTPLDAVLRRRRKERDE